jgi:ABC-type glycerol-3-phosphate transport system permease component
MMVAQDRLTLYLLLSIILVVLLFPFYWMALTAGFPASRRFRRNEAKYSKRSQSRS